MPDDLSLNELLALYRTTLFEDVLPFWERYSFDESGAINTCIGDDGSLLSRDR
ncbi:MAG: hypothetical protein UZ16_OP3001003084, partial [Candidatus Hinthialibacteria bacterium OLB16]